jgi:hypothetical protein
MNPLIRDLEINSTAMGWRTTMNYMRTKSVLAFSRMAPKLGRTLFTFATFFVWVSAFYD